MSRFKKIFKKFLVRFLSGLLVGLFVFLNDYFIYKEEIESVPVVVIFMMFLTGIVFAFLAFAFEDLFSWIFRLGKEKENDE